MEKYIKNLINTLEKIDDDVRIKHLVDIFTKKMTAKGRIVIVSAGANKLIIENLINSFNYLFKIEENKFLFLSLEHAFEEITDNWKELENSKSIGAISAMEHDINSDDIVLGLSSTGRTNYINYFLKQSNNLRAMTILISSSLKSEDKKYIDYNMNFPLINKEINGLYVGNHTTIIKIIFERLFFDVFEEMGQIIDGRILTTRMWTEKLLDISMNTIKKYNVNYLGEKELNEIILESKNELSIVVVMIATNVGKDEALDILKKENYNFKKIL